MQVNSFSMRIGMVVFWFAVVVFFLCIPFFKEVVSTEKSINIMSWTELIDPHSIAEFEQQTGIKVNVSYFESNEELYARVKATGGAYYDLLIPSDYAIPWLIKDALIKPIDKSKIVHWDRLDPHLLDHYFDPDNRYSMPYHWQLYGLAVDTNVFHEKAVNPTWGLLFDKNLVHGCVVMPDVAREVVLLAALYLFGTIETIDEKKIQQIYALLMEQKKWVAAYSEMRADFLLTSGVCPVIVSQSTLMWPITREHEHITFIKPKEGTFAVIDNFVIPASTCKEEYVYQFINFLYDPARIKHHFELYRFFPATSDLLPLLNEIEGGQSIKDAHSSVTHDILFFKKTISEQAIKNIWTALKGS